MAKISDIAKATGFGYSTVAQIVSGRRNYRPETVEKVMTTAKTLGYTPNYLSKALAGDKSMSIAIYMSSLDNPVEVEVLHPIEISAKDKGYSTFVSSSNTNNGRALTLIKGLIARKVDGIIFYNTTPLIPEIKELLANTIIPVVYIDTPPEKNTAALVTFDNEPAFTEMSTRLKELGHTEGCFLGNPFKTSFPEKIVKPFSESLKKAGITLHIKENWQCGEGAAYERLAYEVVCRNLDRGDCPKLLIAHNDFAAVGAIAAFADYNIRVPEDVSVVGFEGARFSSFMRPKLSTIELPSRKLIGKKAFEMLYMMMKSANFKPSPIVLRSKFVQGETITEVV